MGFRGYFQKFRPENLKSEYYKKVLMSFLLISCVVFMLFSLLLFLSANEEYDATLESIQEQTLNQAQYVNQTTLKDIVSYCYRMQEDSDMRLILYGDSFDAAMHIEALELNRNLRRSSSLIHSGYFINFRTHTVVDATGRMNIDVHSDKGIYDILDEMSPSQTPMFCYPRVIPSRQSATFYTDVPVLSIIFYQNRSGAMVVNLDYELYRQLFPLDTGTHIQLMMFNNEGRVIASSDPELFGEDFSQRELYRSVAQTDENSGSLSHRYEGVNYSVNYIKNAGMQITYLCVRDNQLVYADNGMLPPLLRFTAVSLLIGLLLSLVLSRIIYDPMKRLKRSIARNHPSGAAELTKPDTPSPFQDFDYLSHVYREITEMNARLLQDSHARQNADLFTYLLDGNLDSAAVRYASQVEELDATFSGKNYAIVLLGLDLPASEEELSMEQSLLRYAVQNVAHELLSGVTTTYPVTVKSDFVIFLVNFDTLDMAEVLRVIKEAQAFIQTNFSIGFSAGVGDAVQDLRELFQSYVSAFEALSQRFVSGHGSIHVAWELRMTPTDAQVYPYETAEALLAAVKSLAADDARRLAKEFVDSIRTYDIEQILSFMLQLHFSLQRMENTHYIQTAWDWNYRALEMSTLNEIEAQLIRRCQADVEQLSSVRSISSGSPERKELIEQIETLVEENIYNPELTVTFLANEVHLSVNYLRNIFKDSTGSSLSNYINSKKIDIICQLLVETDMTLTAINDKLGFSTRNYFYAFFKKHIGMTPGDYRKKMKPANE